MDRSKSLWKQPKLPWPVRHRVYVDLGAYIYLLVSIVLEEAGSDQEHVSHTLYVVGLVGMHRADHGPGTCLCMQVSEYNMPAWRSGKEDFERRMEPLEHRVSQKLRELFGEYLAGLIDKSG